MIIAVTMVRNEADVIGPVLTHLFNQGVDRVVVADNMSTDDTRTILEQTAESHPVTILDDNEFGHRQGAKMTGLARAAHEMGAEWVLPFDGDEVWSGTVGTIAESLAVTKADVVMAPGWDHIVTREGDGPFSPWRRKRPQTLCKVAFRARPDIELNEGNHDVRPDWMARVRGPLTFRHFQYRSLEQMAAKLRHGRAAMEASGVDPMHGTHWREGGLLSDDEMAAKWAALCSEGDLVFDPVTL
jgi:hypothetical protein